MNQIAAILNHIVLYRYSLILALAAGAGICFFMAFSSHARISSHRAAAAAFTAILFSLPLSRLIYWYGRADSFSSLYQALTVSSTKSFALTGAFLGCLLSALLFGKQGKRAVMLDCMSVSGCWAISLGRLGCFFSPMDRGQIMTHLTSLPWAYPVTNASGQLEYRFATFLFQAAVAALLGIVLTILFFRKKRDGDITLVFLLVYSASQILLDSTRYDSLYLRSNGFVSIVQILTAVMLLFVVVFFSVQAVKKQGYQKWMLFAWLSLALFFGCAGYMEYYVQRHGREAAFAYSIMGTCLMGIVLFALYFRKKSLSASK